MNLIIYKMKRIVLLSALLSCTYFFAASQILFIEKATIQFEVKTNIKKAIGDGMFGEMIKENLPTFKTAYYNYTFANNKSIFKLDHFDEKAKIPDWFKADDEAREWFTDFATGTMQMKQSAWGSSMYVKDSLPKIEWRLVNENMNIAGFNCRKAVTKIFDSVYVFVYYTEEIPISGGPCTISGLPGMIMAMTIPRLYTSWVATKVTVNGVNESIIKPAEAKKPMTKTEFSKFMMERTKDWGGGDEEGKHFKEQFLWEHML
ncbi:MAG: GLPGLI family protein [Ferruginibacter sp.]